MWLMVVSKDQELSCVCVCVWGGTVKGHVKCGEQICSLPSHQGIEWTLSSGVNMLCCISDVFLGSHEMPLPVADLDQC